MVRAAGFGPRSTFRMQGTVPAQKTQPDIPAANVAPPAANAAPAGLVVTPADVSRVLFKRKWLILILALAGTAIGLYHALTTTPLYEAMSQIYIDLGSSNNLGLGIAQQNYMFDMPEMQLQTKLAKRYISEIVRLHGVPLFIISDRGTQFTSKF